MSDTTVLLKKPTEILRQDHERVRVLFDRYENADRARKWRIFLDIDEELSIHARIDKTILYPAVRNADPEGVREALEDHRVFRILQDELMEMGGGHEGFDAKVKELERSVERHTRMEEAEIFPLATKLPRGKLQELSIEMRGLRDHPTRKDRPEEIPFYPTLGMPDDGDPPFAPDPRENKPRGYENWGSE